VDVPSWTGRRAVLGRAPEWATAVGVRKLKRLHLRRAATGSAEPFSRHPACTISLRSSQSEPNGWSESLRRTVHPTTVMISARAAPSRFASQRRACSSADGNTTSIAAHRWTHEPTLAVRHQNVRRGNPIREHARSTSSPAACSDGHAPCVAFVGGRASRQQRGTLADGGPAGCGRAPRLVSVFGLLAKR
jgi:hypothetical protein